MDNDKLRGSGSAVVEDDLPAPGDGHAEEEEVAGRPARVKIHLVDSDEPLREGDRMVALCGTVVDCSHFTVMWDEVATGKLEIGVLILSNRYVCRKCKVRGIEKRYIYGVVEASSIPIVEGEW